MRARARVTAGSLANRELGGGHAGLLGIVLVIALGGGAAIGAAVAAYRTDRAYPDYIDRADVAEVVVNPSVSTQAMDEAIRGFDGIETVRRSSLLLGTVSITEPTPMAEAVGSDSWLQVLGSSDGRFTDVDRPAVRTGRVPSGQREVFVSDDYRSTLEEIEGRSLHVGDTIDVAFLSITLFVADIAPTDIVSPLGVESLRISGFGVLPDEVLPDELYPRQRLIVSADVTERYDCLTELRPDMTDDEAIAASFPQACSSQYHYYSINLLPGFEAESIRSQFAAASARLTPDLPPAVVDNRSGYFYVSQDRNVQDDAVRQTTRPTIAALMVFAAVAALATLASAALIMARLLRRNAAAHRSLMAIGATRAQRAAWSATPLFAAAAIGLTGAAIVALCVSPIGPLGSVRAVQPSAGFSLPAAVTLPAIGVLTAFIASIVAVTAVRTSRDAGDEPTRTDRPAKVMRFLVHGSRPQVTTGISAAMGSRRGGASSAVLVGCVVATTAGVTAIVFGFDLTSFVDRPASYGWPWDVAMLTGAGYGDTVADVVEADLDRDDVDDYSFLAFDSSSFLGDAAAPVIYGFANAADTEFPILSGRLARSAGEAVIGAATADALDLHIGDQLTATSVPFGERPVVVVGIAVLPSLGAFLADRTGLDTGAFILVDADPVDGSEPSFVAVRLSSGTDSDDFVGDLRSQMASWDANGQYPIVLTAPVRSPEIVNVSELRSSPMILGALLIGMLAIGLALSIGISVRDRRREFAILRSLGFSGRDIHATVRWQAITIVSVGALAGVPLGIVAGRFAWMSFAGQLGVGRQASVPFGWLALVVAGTLVLALAAAAPSARFASRCSPADVLRST